MRVFEMWKDLLIGMKIKAETRQKCTRMKGKKDFIRILCITRFITNL